MRRRSFLYAIPATSTALLLGSLGEAEAADSFNQFLVGVDSMAAAKGVSYRTRLATLRGLQANADVIRLNNHQPEFTQTWAEYSQKRLSQARIAAGQQKDAAYRGVLSSVRAGFGVDPGVIMGIWGLETNYGSYTGGYSVVQSLATLGWTSARRDYFRNELISALQIIDGGAVSPQGMTGSWAGAMGQPQFMPSVYQRLAVSYDGHGRPDIWTSVPDSLASIANYLRRSGWRMGETWGEAVILPPDVNRQVYEADQTLALSRWLSLGVRRLPQHAAMSLATPARLVLPDGVGGASFLAYPNFKAIRRYNPSDYYALSVGLLGDLVTA